MLLHNTTMSYPIYVRNFKILGVVVPEKSLAEKKFTHTYAHCYEIGENYMYIPRIYFVCQGALVTRKFLTKTSVERKKNGQIMRT